MQIIKLFNRYFANTNRFFNYRFNLQFQVRNDGIQKHDLLLSEKTNRIEITRKFLKSLLFENLKFESANRELVAYEYSHPEFLNYRL